MGDGLHTGRPVARVHRLHDGLCDVRMACPHHVHGIGPTCPVCCFPQPERTSQLQAPCHKWQTCGCFRTGRHCIGSDPQDLIVVTPGEIGCQLRADGADVEVGPRCSAVEQQQPCALQVLHFWDDLGKFPFNEFLPPHWGAQDGDFLGLLVCPRDCPSKLWRSGPRPLLLLRERRTCLGQHHHDSRCSSFRGAR